MAWNRPTSNTGNATSSSRPSGRGKMPRLRRGLLAGVIVVLGAGLAAWLLTNGEAASSPLQKKDRGLIREVAPATVPKKQSDSTSTQTVPVKPAKTAVPQEVVKSVETNASGFIVENVIQANGRPLIRVKEPPSIWESETDRVIASFVSLREGQQIPPFPPFDANDEAKFLASLEKPIKILETDSEEIKVKKLLVSEAREAIKERMDAGESFRSILEDHRSLFNENGNIRAKAANELLEIKRSGDAEGARRYEIMINAALSQMGISPIGGNDSSADDDEN